MMTNLIKVKCDSVPDYRQNRNEWIKYFISDKNIQEIKERLKKRYSSYSIKEDGSNYLTLSKYYCYDEEESRISITISEAEQL